MQLSYAESYNARRMAQSEDPRKNTDEAERGFKTDCFGC